MIKPMNDNWQKIILSAKPAGAPRDLLPRVIARVNEEKAAGPLRLKFFIYSALTFLSAVSIVFAVIVAKSEFAKSDFPAFLALVWTDSSVVFAYWKSYLASLAETLPTMSVILVLAAVFAFVNFIRMAAKNVGAVHPHIRRKTA